MRSFQRAFTLFSIVIASGFFVGCGGPGAPVPGGSDPVTEAADGALAPEGEPAAVETEASPEASPQEGTTPEATESAPADAEAASPPE